MLNKQCFSAASMLFFILLLINSNTATNTNLACKYQFTNLTFPVFTLPPAQPQSPGDFLLNPGNPIRLSTGTPLSQGCNSGAFSYQLPNGEFKSTYINSNGKSVSIANQIYATGSQVKIRTIQTTEANLASFLNGKVLKLELTCNNNLVSCILFMAGTAQTTTPTTTTSTTTSTTTPTTTTTTTTTTETTTTTTTTTTETTATTVSLCENGVQDQDETDIDCGGSTCEKRCEDAQKCIESTDCIEVLSCRTPRFYPPGEYDYENPQRYCEDPNACFSKDEKVTMADFQSKPINEVQTGDLIWTMSDHSTQMQLSEVMMVSHNAPNDKANFYTIETMSGHRLSLTGAHYIRVHQYGYLQAKKLSTNHSLYVLMSDKTVDLSPIRTIRTEIKTGIYNLFTLEGTYMVNGIAASSYINITHFSHDETHHIVAPLRWTYWLTKPLNLLENIYPIKNLIRHYLIIILKSYFDALVFFYSIRNVLSTTSIAFLSICSLAFLYRITVNRGLDENQMLQKKID